MGGDDGEVDGEVAGVVAGGEALEGCGGGVCGGDGNGGFGVVVEGLGEGAGALSACITLKCETEKRRRESRTSLCILGNLVKSNNKSQTVVVVGG